MHEREAHLIPERTERPDFGDRNLEIGAQAFGGVDARRWNVQMERRSKAGKSRPLRHRFQMIDGFRGLDFDSTERLPTAIGREQHEVGIPG